MSSSKYSSEADVRVLLSGSYNLDMIAGLEDYVQAACEGQAPYVFDAVRTLVKLYQIFRPRASTANLGRCCCLAFVHGPDGDTQLLALQYMIPSIVLQEQEPIVTVLQCSATMTACQFTQFWKAYDGLLQYSADPILAGLARQSIAGRQQAILRMLALSYQTAPTALVLQAIQAASASTLKQLSSTVVASVTDETVTWVSTPDNTKRQRVFVEGATFATVSALMGKLQQAAQ